MESFFSRYKNALVLVLVLLLQLLGLAVQAKRPSRNGADPRAVSLVRYGVTMVVAPPEKILRATGLWFRNVWGGYIDLIGVRRDNAALKSEIERLRLEQASVVEDARQGQRLQRLLGFREQYIYKTTPAQVIGTSGTDQSRIVLIDKGSDDGLEPDMPVMTADGIVGRLKDVFPSTSQVLLISDSTSGVGVILETTRTRGILKGSTYGQMQVINVSPDERIKRGDRIITSGGDQIFPRGMPVGTVERVLPDPDRDPLLDVVVQPAANLSRLDEVLVITGMGAITSAQEAKDLAESEAEGEAAQKRASDILSERLPSRIDPTAPADTNPDQNVDSTGNVVRPLQPPKPLHPDGFTPNATPPASELIPGQRIVPVKNGTEELPVAKAQPIRKAENSAGASSAAAATGGAVAGASPTRRATEVDANGVERPAASRTADATGTDGQALPKRMTTPTNPKSATPAAPSAGSTSPGSTISGSTSPGSPPAGSLPHVRTAPTPATASGQTAPLATPTTTPRPGGLTPQPTTHVIDDGPENPTPRPATTARPGAPATTAKSPAQTPATQKPSTPGTTKPATPGITKPSPAGTTAKPATAGTTAKPAAPGATATPARKTPILVPDDGSRPPAAVKPKPAPKPQPAPPQTKGEA